MLIIKQIVKYSTKIINVDNYVSYNGVNAKNVVKNHLFLDKKMKSVKRKK